MNPRKAGLDRFWSWMVRRFAIGAQDALRLSLVLLWLVGIGLLIWLVWGNWNEIRPYLADADPRMLALSSAGYLLSIVAAVLGWMRIIEPLAPGVPWREHARIYAVTLVARRLPGTLWYVGGRLVLYGRSGVTRTVVAIASGIELVVFVVSGALLGLVLIPQLSSMGSSLAVLLGGAALAMWFTPNFIAFVLERRGVPTLPKKSGRVDLLIWIGVYAANWISGGLMVAAIIGAFTPVDMGDLPFIIGAWALSGAIGTLTVFLPTTFGLVEVSLSLLLSSMMPLPLAVVIAIVTRITTFVFDLLLAAVLYPFVRRSQPDPSG